MINGEEPAGKSKGFKSLTWWWALWLVSILTVAVYFYFAVSADSVLDLEEASISNVISSLVDIPAAMVTISLIKKLSKVEKQWYEMILEKKDDT